MLAGFVALHPALAKPVLLALATGTKCLPLEEVAPHLVLARLSHLGRTNLLRFGAAFCGIFAGERPTR